MRIGSGFVIVATWALIGLGLTAAMAPDPARMAGYFPAAYRTTFIDCPDFGGTRVAVLDRFLIAWYGGMLVAADEPSLYAASRRPDASRRESWRFDWLRTFHKPVFIRVDRLANGALSLTATRLDGKGGYSPGAVEARAHRMLTPQEEARFRAALQAADGLDLPPSSCQRGADGAEWIFEANDKGAYRYVHRWTPQDGPLRSLGETMIGLTGWKLDPIY